MRVGADGCAWMRWGAWGMGDTQTRQEGGIYGRAGQDWGAMAGEISPDMMFFGVWQKWAGWVQMGKERFCWARMDVRARGGAENKAKRAPNGSDEDVL